MRVPAGQAAKVRAVIADDAGQPVAGEGVTAAAVDGAGAVVALGDVTAVEPGVYDVALPAQQRLDQLRVTVAATVAGAPRSAIVDVDVVEQLLVDPYRLAEAMRQDQAPGAPPVTAQVLEQASAAAEAWLADALNYPPVRRGLRTRFVHRGGAVLKIPGVLKPAQLYELAINDQAMSADELAAAGGYDEAFGWMRRGYGDWPAGFATVWCTHGLWSPPDDLRRAAVVLARYLAKTSKVPERAVSMTTESTLIVFSRPDPNKPTGLPEVDAVITRRRIGTAH